MKEHLKCSCGHFIKNLTKNAQKFLRSFLKQEKPMPFNDVMINKIQSIQRCIFRAKEEY